MKETAGPSVQWPEGDQRASARGAAQLSAQHKSTNYRFQTKTGTGERSGQDFVLHPGKLQSSHTQLAALPALLVDDVLRSYKASSFIDISQNNEENE